MRTILLAPLLAGCFGTVFHLERNAPGTGSVRQPPPEIEVGHRVRPDDPGERMVSVVPEVSFGGGLWEESWSLVSTAELGGWYGENPTSHVSDSIFGGDMRVIPLWSVGGAVGYDLLPLGQAERRLTVLGRVTSEGMGIEGGWGLEPTAREHSAILGLFLSSWSRFAFLRLVWGPERGFGGEAGIALDYALTWVWSR